MVFKWKITFKECPIREWNWCTCRLSDKWANQVSRTTHTQVVEGHFVQMHSSFHCSKGSGACDNVTKMWHCILKTCKSNEKWITSCSNISSAQTVTNVNMDIEAPWGCWLNMSENQNSILLSLPSSTNPLKAALIPHRHEKQDKQKHLPVISPALKNAVIYT